MTFDGDSAEPVWQPAVGLLDEIARRTEAGAVLRAAYRGGLMDRLAQPALSAVLAADLAVDESRLASILEVLRSIGVADLAAGMWSLTVAWASVMAGESPLDLGGYLEAPLIRSTQFENCLTGGQDYWQLSVRDRLSVARGVSFNPTSPFMPGMLRRDLGLLDGVLESLDAGGAVLELGCGVGSRLTALALTFPRLRAVGVELDADLAGFGRDRANALGVGDRVTYVVGDAARYEPTEQFDLVTWSQFFFPTPTRSAALGTAYRALRPGGWVTAPVIWTGEARSPIGEEAEELAREGLNLHMWGVPARTTAEVRAELEAAGFVDVRVDDMTFILLVRGRRQGR